jgi:hypothetical protein
LETGHQDQRRRIVSARASAANIVHKVSPIEQRSKLSRFNIERHRNTSSGISPAVREDGGAFFIQCRSIAPEGTICGTYAGKVALQEISKIWAKVNRCVSERWLTCENNRGLALEEVHDGSSAPRFFSP